MQIAISDKDIIEFMEIINRHEQEHPVLVDKYLMGKEIEVDAVCDGHDILDVYKRQVYAGGDVVTGAATVILAMGAGKKAAKAIDESLKEM